MIKMFWVNEIEKKSRPLARSTTTCRPRSATTFAFRRWSRLGFPAAFVFLKWSKEKSSANVKRVHLSAGSQVTDLFMSWLYLFVGGVFVRAFNTLLPFLFLFFPFFLLPVFVAVFLVLVLVPSLILVTRFILWLVFVFCSIFGAVTTIAWSTRTLPRPVRKDTNKIQITSSIKLKKLKVVRTWSESVFGGVDRGSSIFYGDHESGSEISSVDRVI